MNMVSVGPIALSDLLFYCYLCLYVNTLVRLYMNTPLIYIAALWHD